MVVQNPLIHNNDIRPANSRRSGLYIMALLAEQIAPIWQGYGRALRDRIIIKRGEEWLHHRQAECNHTRAAPSRGSGERPREQRTRGPHA